MSPFFAIVVAMQDHTGPFVRRRPSGRADGLKAPANLVGKDFSGLLKSPASAKVDAVRDGALYCFNMWLLLDPNYMKKVADFIRANGIKGVRAFVKRENLEFDLDSLRGAIRSVYDGRYKFSRYFPP